MKLDRGQGQRRSIITGTMFPSWLLGTLLIACSGQVISVKTNRDGNSEYWVCQGGEAKACEGEREGDADPEGFQHRSQVLMPEQCQHGVASMEVVLDGHEIERVRYQCALPDAPTGLPSAGSGLPPSSDDLPARHDEPPTATPEAIERQ